MKSFEWPQDKVGDGYHLLGLVVAALGVPGVSPWLRHVEAALAAATAYVGRWLTRKAEQVRDRWRRFRGHVVLVGMAGEASAAGGATAVMTTLGEIDRSDLPERERLELLEHEIFVRSAPALPIRQSWPRRVVLAQGERLLDEAVDGLLGPLRAVNGWA